ncbi:MAG: hypothetical protein V9G04_12710 [Nocardioides sp.]
MHADRARRLAVAILLALSLGFLSVPSSQAAAPAEGAYVSYGGHIYRIAGGAPLYITAAYWATFATKPTVTALTAADWGALAAYPRDNTYIRAASPTGGNPVYVIAGGAPVYVSWTYWSSLATKPTLIDVDETTVNSAGSAAPNDRLRAFPATGTFLQGVQAGSPDDGTVYRVAGGAPVHVSDWAVFGGVHSSVRVGLDAIEQAGSGGYYNRLRYRPAEGTILRVPDGTKYRVESGAPIPFSTTGAGALTDPAAIANAGKPGRWSHLAAPPPPPTVPDTTPPDTWIIAGPTGSVATPTVSYAFQADEPSTFECSWDDAAWQSCTSPAARDLSRGAHVFSVRATDNAGNVDPTPASRGVIVDATTTRIVARVKAVRKSSRLRVDLDPDSASRHYRFVVQRKTNGKWKRVRRTRTKGPKERRTLDLPKGVYRVKVPQQLGLRGTRTKKVRLVR